MYDKYSRQNGKCEIITITEHMGKNKTLLINSDTHAAVSSYTDWFFFLKSAWYWICRNISVTQRTIFLPSEAVAIWSKFVRHGDQ